MVENKQEELQHKLVDVVSDVGQDLIEHKDASTPPNLKNLLRFRPGFNWRPSDQFMKELMKPPTIAEKFSADEINDKLKKAFTHRGLKDTKFEFCISSDLGGSSELNSSTYEIKSRNFL